MEDKCIKVWVFHEAPEELQKLSRNGGDEDYVMLVPPEWKMFWPDPDIHLQGGFGACDVETHTLEDGSIVHIGSHS